MDQPQLAALVKAASDGRMHAPLDAGSVNILTRRGNDWTHKYPAIAEAVVGLPAKVLAGTGEARDNGSGYGGRE